MIMLLNKYCREVRDWKSGVIERETPLIARGVVGVKKDNKREREREKKKEATNDGNDMY